MGIEGLTPGERLMFHIGQVCQTHVWLDGELRTAYLFLVPSGEEDKTKKLQATTELVEGCRQELERADLPEEVKDAAETVLKAVEAANEDRNRVVHDLWFNRLTDAGELPVEGPRWDLWRRDRRALSGQALPSRPADLEYAEETREALGRARLRVWAMWSAVTETLPSWRGARAGLVSHLDFWLQVMLDRFTVQADGGVRPLD